MKQHQMIIWIMAVIFSFLCSASLAAGAQKIMSPATGATIKPVKCTRPPEVQVVNNSGIPIFQVKLGKMIFHENLSACTDGCSTGFHTLSAGYHPVEVKIEKTSPWVNIGSVGPFEGCLHYAVNMVKKSNLLCAELYVRKNTNPTFNNDATRKKVSQVCKPMASGPVLKTGTVTGEKIKAAPTAPAEAAAPTAPTGMTARATAAVTAKNTGQVQMEFPKAVIENVYFKKSVDNTEIMMTTAQIPGMAGGSAAETVPLIRAEYGERIPLTCAFSTLNVTTLQVRIMDDTGGHTYPSYGEPRETADGKKQYRFETGHIARSDQALTLSITGMAGGPVGTARAEKQVRIETKRPVFEVRRPGVNDQTREVTFRIRNTGDMDFPPGSVMVNYAIKGMPGNENIAGDTLRSRNIAIPRNQVVDIGSITLPESALAFDRIEMEISATGTCHTLSLPETTGSYNHAWETKTFTINEAFLSLFSGLFSGNVRINTFEEGHGDRSDSQPYVDDSRLLLTVVDPTAAGGSQPVFDQPIPITSYKFGSDGVEALVLINSLEAPIDGRNLFFIRNGKLGLRIVFDCSARNEIEVWARDAIAKCWRDNWLPDLDLTGFTIELMLTPVQNGQAISYSDLSMNADVNLEMPGHRVEGWLEREASSMIENSFAPVFDNDSVRTTIENTFDRLVNNNPLVNMRYLVSVRGAGDSIVVTYR